MEEALSIDNPLAKPLMINTNDATKNRIKPINKYLTLKNFISLKDNENKYHLPLS
jgi:hypothetical protein